jgi:predicted ATPase
MTSSYSLFIHLFRDYFAWRPEESNRVRSACLRAALNEFVTRGELPAARVEEMAPVLARLLSIGCSPDGDNRLKHASPEQIKHQTFLAIRVFFVALARRQPVILVLEDLQWADSHSLDLIPLLMEALPQTPLLLLCLYRPERERKCRHLSTIASQKCLEQYTSSPEPADAGGVVAMRAPA